MMPGSAANRLVHRACPSTTRSGPFGSLPAHVNIRPAATCTPSVVVMLAVTLRRGYPLRLAVAGQVDLAVAPRRHLRQRAAAAAIVVYLPAGDPGLVEVGPLAPDHHRALRLAPWQRPQQHGVDDAENGGVGADAERQGHHRDRRQSPGCAAARARRNAGRPERWRGRQSMRHCSGLDGPQRSKRRAEVRFRPWTQDLQRLPADAHLEATVNRAADQGGRGVLVRRAVDRTTDRGGRRDRHPHEIPHEKRRSALPLDRKAKYLSRRCRTFPIRSRRARWSTTTSSTSGR